MTTSPPIAAPLSTRAAATPQRLCFPMDQWYTKKTAEGKPELVKWSGASDSATPASCIDVVSS